MRETDLNIGIVMETYRNGSEHAVRFEDLSNRAEDKKLMFEELYQGRLQTHQLKPYESLVQFYEISRIPAKLFIPEKKLVIGDHASESVTFHQVLK